MHDVQSIAVGSIPSALAPLTRSGALCVSSTPTRLQCTDITRGEDLFHEFKRLADGEHFAGGEPDPAAVRKAQVPGPVTLIVAQVETLQTSIRRIRAAIDSLYAVHPALEEVWLDEPLLAQAPDDWTGLLARLVRALKAEYFDLRIGIHCCAPVRNYETLKDVNADAWSFDLSGAEYARVVDAKHAGFLVGTLVWSVISTDGSAPIVTPQEILKRHDALQPEAPLRISTGCGLGTRDETTVRGVIAHQDAFAHALRALVEHAS